MPDDTVKKEYPSTSPGTLAVLKSWLLWAYDSLRLLFSSQDAKKDLVWVERTEPEDRPGWLHFDFVDRSTDQVVSGVTRHGEESNWLVFRNGKVRGEYTTKVAAMKRAEAIV